MRRLNKVSWSFKTSSLVLACDLSSLQSLKGHLCYLLPLAGNFLRLHQLVNSTPLKESKIDELLATNLENEAMTMDTAEAWNLYTDASDSGFGAVLHDNKGKLIANLALENKLHLPISELEMKAVWTALARFGQLLKKRCRSLTIHIDSMVVKRCLAGEASSMSITNIEYKKRIEGLLGSYHITTNFRYIPSKENPADDYSREYEIKNKIKDPWVLKRLS
eukprot:GHVP01011931.1.p1 GENE.GHVP01011931.1~~GHVP01011931.1.p1  ORF type:complete len:220 (+),score=9.43 GHVP01011931.1:397-1056(+)